MTSNTIMTVSWPAISNRSNSDPHSDSGLSASFCLTYFDWYTVHFARTIRTDKVYSVQEYQIVPTRMSSFLTTLRLGTLDMLHDMGFALDDNRWQTGIYLFLLWDSFEEWIRSYDKHDEAKYHDLQHHHDGYSVLWLSNIKSVRLRHTLWLGTQCT